MTQEIFQAITSAYNAAGAYLGMIFAIVLIQLTVVVFIKNRKLRTWALHLTIAVQALAAVLAVVVAAKRDLFIC